MNFVYTLGDRHEEVRHFFIKYSAATSSLSYSFVLYTYPNRLHLPPLDSLQSLIMAENPHSPLESNFKEWEFLPDDASFLEFHLGDANALLCNEIIHSDYFRSEPCKLIRQSPPISHQDEGADTKIKLKKEEPMERSRPAIAYPEQSRAELDLSLDETDPPLLPSLMNDEEAGGGEEREKATWERRSVGIWKWRLSLVKAVCSLVAAAAAVSICVLALGGRGMERSHRCRNRNRSVPFIIHGNSKRLVEEAAEEALPAAGGAPTMMRAATVSFAGYYSAFDS